MNDLVVLEEDLYIESDDILDQLFDNTQLVIESSKIKLPGDKLYIDSRKKNWLYVYVFGDEGPYPHFHVYNKDTKGYKDLTHSGACISLIENKYFNHADHDEELTEEEFNVLADYIMNEKVPALHPKKDGTRRKIPAWRFLISAWNELNQRYQIKPGTKCPEYSFEDVGQWKEE